MEISLKSKLDEGGQLTRCHNLRRLDFDDKRLFRSDNHVGLVVVPSDPKGDPRRWLFLVKRNPILAVMLRHPLVITVGKPAADLAKGGKSWTLAVFTVFVLIS